MSWPVGGVGGEAEDRVPMTWLLSEPEVIQNLDDNLKEKDSEQKRKCFI